MQSLAQSIEGGAIYTMVTSNYWLWPMMEIIHFIGLSLLLGAMVIFDLRLAGYLRHISLVSVHKLIPWALLGLGMNVVTGVLFYFGDPVRYTANVGFRIKMILIMIAGLNALWFFWVVSPIVRTWGPHADTPRCAKVGAYVSLFVWVGVLLLGRLIPYVGTG